MGKVFLSAGLAPKEVIAADSTEFIIKLVVGPGYVQGASRIVFDFTATLGTSVPSLYLNEDSGYVQVYVTNPLVTYTARCWDLDHQYYTDREHPRSREAQRMVVLDLSAGLKKGDVIELHWGDPYGGFCPGAKVTSVVPRPDYHGRIDVRYFDSHEKGMPDKGWTYEDYERPVPNESVRLEYRVLPRAPHHLRLIRKPDRALLVPHDLFWNVANVEKASDVVTSQSVPTKNAAGAFEYADRNVKVASKALPLRQTPTMDNVFEGMNLYWGDLHTHCAYSRDCIRRSGMDMKPDDLMAFARDRSGLDFYALSDHHDPWREPSLMLTREMWEDTLEAVRKYDEPGRFVVWPGIEYGCRRGECVVIFNWLPEYREIREPAWQDVRDIWAGLRGKDFITIPHYHNPGKLEAGTWWAPEDSRIEPVLEIFSDHGSFEREDVRENGRADCKHFRFDRCGAWYLKNGFRYGFAGNSDDHKGHVGVNGVTAAFASSLDRNAILDAYRRRHVYATTNARIRLIFTGNGKLMGSVVPNSPDKELRIDAAGESPLKRVDLFRNGDLCRQFVPEGIAFKTSLRIAEDEPSNWYVRVTQLDNHIAWSSPIWFE